MSRLCNTFSSCIPVSYTHLIKTLTERWPSGLDEDVQHIRAKNKERILHALVQKIEHRKNPASRFHFEEGLSYEEKFNLCLLYTSRCV